MNKPLFIYNNKEIWKEDFKAAFKSLGIKDDDVLFVHSDVSVFGNLIRPGKAFILDGFIEVLQEAIPNGTLILPAFTYSFCKGEKFNVKKSRSTVGSLTEHFRKKENVLRTRHPIFSVAIWGNKNGFLDIGKDSFDEESIFGKLHKKNAKLLFLGAPFRSCTYVHYIEQMHGIPYRYIKPFRGSVIDEDGVDYEDECTFFARYLDCNVEFNIENGEKYFLDNGYIKKEQVGSGKILLIDASVFYEEGFKLLDRDIFYFLNTKPDMEEIEKQKCQGRI